MQIIKSYQRGKYIKRKYHLLREIIGRREVVVTKIVTGNKCGCHCNLTKKLLYIQKLHKLSLQEISASSS